MERDAKKEIEKIMGNLECPKDFKCYRSGFEDLCKAKVVGTENHLLCLEEEPTSCTFSVFVGNTYYCQCPLRIYLTLKLNKQTVDCIAYDNALVSAPQVKDRRFESYPH